MPGQWRAIGVVRRAVGLKGFCSIEPFGAAFSSLRPPSPVRLGRESGSAVAAVIAEVLELPSGFQCRFEGREDRTSSEQLRGMLIFAEQETLPALLPNEFYHDEIRGMAVRGDGNDGIVGTVIGVLELPSTAALEVGLDRGESIIVPLSGNAIVSVDRRAGLVTVNQEYLDSLLGSGGERRNQ